MPNYKKPMKPLSGVPKMKKGAQSSAAKTKVMSKVSTAKKTDKPKGYKG